MVCKKEINSLTYLRYIGRSSSLDLTRFNNDALTTGEYFWGIKLEEK